jgi:hypothetical protein
VSWGKVRSLHQDPKDADFQGSRINSRLKASKILGFQHSKVPGFQGLSFQVFPGSMALDFNDTRNSPAY